jgi:hypothetical protein
MHFRRPRYTILSLMTVVLVAGLLLAIFVVYRDRYRRVAAQKVATASALANYLNASLTREAAEIAVTEYTEGVLKSDLETVDGEIALAKTDLMRASERLDATKRQAAQGKASDSSLAENDKDARRAKLRLEHALERKTRLAGETKERTLKELNVEVESAKANEALRKAEYDHVQAGVTGQF